MNLDELSKKILLSLRANEANVADNMDPDNPLIPNYDNLKKKGLILIEKIEEGGIVWAKLTTIGEIVQKQLV